MKRKSRDRGVWALSCLGLWAGLCSPSGAGASFNVTPELVLTQRYTDNVNLSATTPSSAFIAGISPGIRLKSLGGRAQFDLDYNLDALAYSNNTGGNSLHHQLNLNGRMELLEDRLMLLLQSRVTEQNASLTGATGGTALPGGNRADYYTTGNRSKVRTLSAQPVWRTRFGADAQLEASWQASATQTDTTGATGGTRSESDHLSLNLTSGSAFPRTPWNLRYTRLNTRGVGNSTRINSLSAGIGVQPSPRTRLTLTVGQDSNNGVTAALGDSAGPYWNFGVSWTPNNRISLDANLGRRYNGASHGLNAQYRHRRFSLALRYSETLQDGYQAATSQESFDLYTCPGVSAYVPVPAGAGAPSEGCILFLAGAAAQVTTLTNTITLNHTWSGLASYSFGNHLLALSYQSSQRDLITSGVPGDSDSSLSIAATWSMRLGSRMGSVLSLARSKAEAGAQESQDSALAWSLTRKLSADASGALDLRRTQRDVGTATGTYSENSISTRINMSF